MSRPKIEARLEMLNAELLRTQSAYTKADLMAEIARLSKLISTEKLKEARSQSTTPTGTPSAQFFSN